MKQLIILLSFTFILACEEIEAPNITEDQVVLLAPSDDFISTDGQISLWWQELNGSDNFRLQIVSPDFINTNLLIIDTVQTESSYSISLPSGDYEWRVKAMNIEFETEYSKRTFKVE